MIKASKCAKCRHLGSLRMLADGGSVPTCKAFPKGIPPEIGRGDVNHDEIVTGQTRDYVWVLDEKGPWIR